MADVKRIWGSTIIDADLSVAGTIYSGKTTTVGATRTWQAQGTVADITLQVVPKGAGTFQVPIGYEANVSNDRDIINRAWANAHLVGQDIDGLLIAPGPTEDGYAVTWDDDTQTFTLAPGGAGTITAVNGTSNRIAVATLAGVVAVDIDANYIGQASITTLGTVTTGTWNADVIALAKGGTGVALADPGADRVMFWDDSAGAIAFLTVGAGLTIAGTTLAASLSSSPLSEYFAGTGSQTEFTLVNSNPVSIYLVEKRGQIMIEGTHYTKNNSTKKVTMTVPPAIGDNLGIYYFISVSVGAGEIYAGVSPTTYTVGGLPSGTNILGKTSMELWELVLAAYIPPVFNAFAISGQAQTIEVGTALSGTKTFTWGTTNSTLVAVNSVAIRDVTTNTLIASGLANDNTENVAIGTITNTSPISHSWRAEATDTHAGAMVSSNFTVTSLYPYFYGKVASGGVAPGSNRPTANQALINSGTKVVASSTGTITLPFVSTSDDYIWFAVPASSPTKTIWFVDSLNNGSIGGSVSPGGNLFPAFSTVSIDSPTSLWTAVSFEIYISNYQTAAASMQIQN